MNNKGFSVCFLSVLKFLFVPETKRLQLFSDNKVIIDSECITSILKSRKYLVNTHKPNEILKILIGKNCQRDHTNVLIVVLNTIQHKNAFSLRHQLVKSLFMSFLNSNNSLKNGKLK